MSEGTMKYEVEITTGVTVPIERYNRFTEWERDHSNLPKGVIVEIVCDGTSCAFVVPPDTLLLRLAVCCIQIFGKSGKSYDVRQVQDVDGVMLELSRPISVYEIQGQNKHLKLFIGLIEKAEPEQGANPR